MLENSWQEQLKSLLNCDLKSLFPVARSIKRELYFFAGPTNSGKTHKAFEILSNADCGVYLAPLRLLALEGYDNLRLKNINASLITGEEELIDDDASHLCSTIEMLDFSLVTDVAVIDEVQMIDDRDRGWAWVNAIIGAPAHKVIMTGSVNALKAVTQIARYLGDELVVEKFERKTPLIFLDKSISLKNLETSTALIAFSRAEVLRLKHKLSKKYSISIIYGNLSPEVRKLEAKRFREKETQILIATDAISMGLNLPIKTIAFSTDEKFDGIKRRKITPSEVAQISGRAGRYGQMDCGFVGGISNEVHKTIKDQFSNPISTIKPPFVVKANIVQIGVIAKYLNTNNLCKILEFYSRNIKFDGPFIAANIDSMLQAAKLIDFKNIDLETKFILSQAPITTNSPKIISTYKHYLHLFETNQKIRYYPPKKFSNFTDDDKILLEAEDEVKLISLYLWLGFKFRDKFIDFDLAENTRIVINNFIELSIKKGIKIKEVNGDKKDYFTKKPRELNESKQQKKPKEKNNKSQKSSFKSYRR